MPALAKRIEIDDEDRAELERIVRSSTAEVRMVERAQIVLGAAEGRSAAEIGRLAPGDFHVLIHVALRSVPALESVRISVAARMIAF